MKIAYIIYPECVVSNRSNGIRKQALLWKELLDSEGHLVDLVQEWGDYDWADYDWIHLFGSSGSWAYAMSKRLKKYNTNLVFSPIIDPMTSMSFINYKLSDYILPFLSAGRLKNSHFNHFADCLNFKRIAVRTDFEGEFIHKNYFVKKERLYNVPLSSDVRITQNEVTKLMTKKENFCFHISSIAQKRKNVLRLIKAAKKFNFKLIIAGNPGTKEESKFLYDEIGNARNIDILGFINEEKKKDLYSRAKVFCLPSLQEGVGIVALDAGLYGCEIAITSIPGPKEYYADMAIQVNPNSVDSIGEAICNLMNGNAGFQPQLSQYLRDNFSKEAVLAKLLNLYKS